MKDDKNSLSDKKNIKFKDIETKVDNQNELKKVKLDKNVEDNIGANVIKTAYNSTLSSAHTSTKTVKTIKKIVKAPNNIKATIRDVKNKPKKVKKHIKNNINYVKDINSYIKQRKYIKATTRISSSITRKLIKGSLKISKIATNVSIKGLRISGNSIENQIQSNVNSEQADDIGTSTLVTGYSSVKTTAHISNKIIKYTNKIRSNLKTARKSKQKKVAKKKNKISKSVENVKNKSKKIKKSSQKTKNILGKAIKSVSKLILKNPVESTITVAIIVVFLLIQSIFNLFFGTHAMLTINFPDNIDTWKSQMERMDKDTHRRIHSGDDLIYKNSSINTTWKDVLAVYYVKYQDMTLQFDSGATGMATYEVNELNPEMWEQVYNLLIEQLGKPYKWGAVGPDSFDCSGLVMWLWGQFGIEIPHRTYEQYQYGELVENVNELLPGDVVYFMGFDPGPNGEPGHVGIYIGNDEFIHSPSTGDVVKVSTFSSRDDFVCARRYIKPSENTSSSESSSSSNSNTESQNNNDNDKYKNLYNSVGQEYGDLFIKVGKEYNLDPYLLAAVAMQESTLNPNAVSEQGCVGLFQLNPITFTKELGFNISDIRDPYINSCAGAMYLNQMLEKTNGDLEAALRCYNFGPGNYDRVGGDVNRMPKETQDYTKYIASHYEDITNGKQLPGIVSPGTTGYSSKLKRIYDLFIDVSSYQVKHTKTHTNSDGTTSTSTYYTTTYVVKKHTLREVEDALNMDEDDREWVDSILEYDNFEEFGEGYNFSFKY